MVARVAYFPLQDGELVRCSICKKRQDKVQCKFLRHELASRGVLATFLPLKSIVGVCPQLEQKVGIGI